MEKSIQKKALDMMMEPDKFLNRAFGGPMKNGYISDEARLRARKRKSKKRRK